MKDYDHDVSGYEADEESQSDDEERCEMNKGSKFASKFINYFAIFKFL